jgi:hypothetical protein
MLVLSPRAGLFLSVGAALPKEPVTVVVPVRTTFLEAPIECELSPPKCSRSPLREAEIPDLEVNRDREVFGWREETQRGECVSNRIER